MRKYAKEILLVIVTTIIVSAISVSATVYFNSENITFTPNNTNWNVTNTNGALNDLYTTMYSGDALAENILTGKTAVTDGGLITGSMPNNGILDWNPDTSTIFNVPAGYYSGGILDSSSAFNKGKSNIENIVQLWCPVNSSVDGPLSYSGTYNFTESYSYVIVVEFTDLAGASTYSTSNMTHIKTFNQNRWNERVEVSIFKNVNKNSSVTYNLNNLLRAGIGVYGIK